MEKNRHFLQRTIIASIRCYQFCVSPLLGRNCRFYPSCSCYSEQAIREWGVLKGLGLTIKRLLKCHPWHAGGLDPVPEIKEK